MTELRRDTWTMPGGRLGPEDPLPRLTGIRGPHGRFKDVDEKELANEAVKAAFEAAEKYLRQVRCPSKT